MSWIKVDRRIKDHWLWNTDESFTKGQAWIDLLVNANYKDCSIQIKGQKIQLLRGQQARSELTLSKVWGWSKNKVRRFLKQLKNEEMIDQQTNHLTSIISICNYDRYQLDEGEGGTPNGTADGTPDGTPDGHLTAHSTRIKELKNKRIKPPISPKGESEPSYSIPDFVDQELFEDFLQLRKQLKAKNTDRAVTALLNKISELSGGNPIRASRIIEQSIMNSWKSVFELRDEIKPYAVPNRQNEKPPHLQPFPKFED